MRREIQYIHPISKESPFRSKDAGLDFHGGIFLFMAAPRVVLDALSFPGLLRILSVPPDFKTPVG